VSAEAFGARAPIVDEAFMGALHGGPGGVRGEITGRFESASPRYQLSLKDYVNVVDWIKRYKTR